MIQETIQLSARHHALLLRICKSDSLTPSEFFNSHLKRRIETERPVAMMRKLGVANAAKAITKPQTASQKSALAALLIRCDTKGGVR